MDPYLTACKHDSVLSGSSCLNCSSALAGSQSECPCVIEANNTIAALKRDLNLAARVGQSLLSEVHEIEERMVLQGSELQLQIEELTSANTRLQCENDELAARNAEMLLALSESDKQLKDLNAHLLEESERAERLSGYNSLASTLERQVSALEIMHHDLYDNYEHYRIDRQLARKQLEIYQRMAREIYEQFSKLMVVNNVANQQYARSSETGARLIACQNRFRTQSEDSFLDRSVGPTGKIAPPPLIGHPLMASGFSSVHLASAASLGINDTINETFCTTLSTVDEIQDSFVQDLETTILPATITDDLPSRPLLTRATSLDSVVSRVPPKPKFAPVSQPLATAQPGTALAGLSKGNQTARQHLLSSIKPPLKSKAQNSGARWSFAPFRKDSHS